MEDIESEGIIGYIERGREKGYVIWADTGRFGIFVSEATVEEAIVSFVKEVDRVIEELKWNRKFYLASELSQAKIEFFIECELLDEYIHDEPYEL